MLHLKSMVLPLPRRLPMAAAALLVILLALLNLNSIDNSIQIDTKDASSSNVHRVRQLLEKGERELFGSAHGLRYAAFGSGTTYGVSSELSNRFGAFPYLISAEIDNYADYSGGANYPAACTETMVGSDNMYDVILLDFYLSADIGLYELVKRLRERYPKAMIFVMKIWKPYMVRRSSSEYGTEKFHEWMQRIGINPNAIDRTLLKNALREDKNHADAQWYFPSRHQDDTLHKAVKDFDGHFWELNSIPDDALGALLQYHYLFDNSFGELSVAGHELTAYHVKLHIGSVYDAFLESVHADEATEGTWGVGDACHFWFTHGNCNLQHSHEWHVVEYDNHAGKYALEVDESGYFNVTNPFDHERTLYLSFLAAPTPPDSIALYPVTRFKGMVSPVEVDLTPIVPMKKDPHSIGIVKTMPIGVLKPGVNTIMAEPISPAQHWFRIMGASFTDPDVAVDTFRFAPPFQK